MRVISLRSAILVAVLTTSLAAQGRDPKQYQQTLENPERVAGLQVERVVTTLGIKPGMRIADLGAGTGVFSLPFAQAVGPQGKVYAIDVDAALLAIVKEKAAGASVSNIETIVAGATDPKVPEPVDLLFIGSSRFAGERTAGFPGRESEFGCTPGTTRYTPTAGRGSIAGSILTGMR